MRTKCHVNRLALCLIESSILVLSILVIGTGCKESVSNDDPSKMEALTQLPLADSLQRRAEMGELDAQYELGLLYEEGKQVPQNHVKAFSWLRKAAERGHPDAQVSLSMMYRLGLGIPRQDSEALKWALKAAEQGNLNGQKAAWVFYTEGDGVPLNWPEAFKWGLKAAMLKDPAAKYNLAFHYSRGLGVTQDLPEAYKWFTLAMADGYPEATNALQELRMRMSESDIVEGIRRASQAMDSPNR